MSIALVVQLIIKPLFIVSTSVWDFAFFVSETMFLVGIGIFGILEVQKFSQISPSPKTSF